MRLSVHTLAFTLLLLAFPTMPWAQGTPVECGDNPLYGTWIFSHIKNRVDEPPLAIVRSVEPHGKEGEKVTTDLVPARLLRPGEEMAPGRGPHRHVEWAGTYNDAKHYKATGHPYFNTVVLKRIGKYTTEHVQYMEGKEHNTQRRTVSPDCKILQWDDYIYDKVPGGVIFHPSHD